MSNISVALPFVKDRIVTKTKVCNLTLKGKGLPQWDAHRLADNDARERNIPCNQDENAWVSDPRGRSPTPPSRERLPPIRLSRNENETKVLVIGGESPGSSRNERFTLPAHAPRP